MRLRHPSLVFGSLATLLWSCQSTAVAAQAPPPAQAASSAAAAPAGAPDFAAVAQRILPSVVSIRVEQQVRQSSFDGRDGAFPAFPGWPGPGRGFRLPAPGPRQGVGSGFVIDRAGLILTNYHVVEDADRIEVTLGTPEGPRRTVTAKLVGKAPDFDVALLRTEQEIDAPALRWGDSDRLKIGEWVMAIGNPFGLSQSTSVGIVSGKHREDLNPSGHQGVYDFLQTDASINPGNSGGPLVDLSGRVVGMNTAISAQGAGIGFAIPASTLSRIVPALREKGELQRSWLGVQIQDLTPELAKSYGLAGTSGALVAEVLPDGPAARAGVQPGDVLLRFDGKPIDQSSALPVLVSLTESGKQVRLELWRNGRSASVDVRLEAHPRGAAGGDAPERESSGLGLGRRSLTPALRERLGVEEARGALVSEVAPGSAAARAGLRPGDVVTEIGGEPVKDAADLGARLQKLAAGQVVRLKVARGGARRFVALEKSR